MDPARRIVLTATAATALGLVACSSDGGPTIPRAEEACERAEPRCHTLFEAQPGVAVPMYRSHRLDQPDSLIRTAVVMIHGSGRDYDRYFETTVAAARAAGVLETSLLVAPRFRTVDDDPEAGAPYWSSGGWKRGHLSRPESSTPRISSYAVLERLVEEIADRVRFPRLERIVVAGHSAGGQVVHRFAAATALPGVPPDLEVRFVVANPSSYLYLGPERWDGAAFTLPDAEACPDYREWHYGFDGLNSYMRDRDLADVRARLIGRDVRILLGTADTLTASLDTTCGAMLQGRRRLERGRTLLRYMTFVDPSHRHREVLIAGVGHSSRAMFTAPSGRVALFDPGLP